MVNPAGLVLGGSLLGGAIDYFGARRARRRQERLLQEIRGLTTTSLRENDDAFKLAFPHLSGAVDTIRTAGQRALAANTRAGATASRLVAEQGRGATRDATADLARRGLGSTSRTPALAGGIARETGRVLGGIGEQVGGMNASILQNTGARVAQGQTTLAGAYIDRAARAAQIRGGLASSLQGTQYESAGGAASALGQAGGLLALLRNSWGSVGSNGGPTPDPLA